MKKSVDLQRRRPRQARARATVDSILEAAVQVLERSGVDALNTNSVAERAGVSIGTLYQYFPDKDAILVAVARREMEKTGTGLAALQKTLIEALVRAMENLLVKTARAGRATERTVLRDERVGFKQIERRVLEWLMAVPELAPVRVRR